MSVKKLAPPLVVSVVTTLALLEPPEELDATTVCVPLPALTIKNLSPLLGTVKGELPPPVIVAVVDPFVKTTRCPVELLNDAAWAKGAALSSLRKTEACESTKP